MSDKSIFEQASISKLRFSSNKGELTTEQLWDLPLQSRSQFDLDTLAKAVNQQLKAVTEESFVNTVGNPNKSLFELKLNILKHIIAAKIQAAEEARVKANRSDEREKLAAILADKQDDALKALTPEELTKRIAELSGK